MSAVKSLDGLLAGRQGMGSAVMRKERGETGLGCVVLLLLVAILGYLVYRIVPVYMERDDFHEALLDISGRATIARWDNRRIIDQVKRSAVSRNFTVEAKDILIQHIRGRPEVVIVVNYTRTEEFPGATCIFSISALWLRATMAFRVPHRSFQVSG